MRATGMPLSKVKLAPVMMTPPWLLMSPSLA
jgi:hypothetical protein